jgi:acetoin:2,6-dichlorophenolindophenol oxidoreductase subunit beta
VPQKAAEPASIVHVPEAPYTVPIGEAVLRREGGDITLVGLGATVHFCLQAAESLAAEGVSCEVVDLRALVPLDRDTVIRSVARTGRLLVVDDDYHSYGVSGEIIASVCEALGPRMKAAPLRIAHPDVPIPFSRVMERFALPDTDKVIAGVRRVLTGKASVATAEDAR